MATLTAPRPEIVTAAGESDPLWYKDAVIYQLHVRAFHDGNGDGVGDFPGLTQKLDYLQDLGVTALWLLPFYPSPLKDDGYDIADYTDVNPAYGTLRDFKQFLAEAHARGLRVITELVLNHTSDQHAWFQRARRSPPGSAHRDYYVWSDTPERYADARIIFKDFEPSNWTWDGVAKAYFWHRFYSHQPDLNFDHPPVRQALFQVLDYWLKLGVDGLRLDAVPYLYEREGTNCENLPETHGYLKELRRRIDQRFDGRMLLAEANQWPEDAIAYFGEGDECHTAFHFPLMPRLFMAIHMEDRFPIIDILQQTPPIPVNCQWVLFLRNHDELTLEMVTDEERDYMYRVYARDREARINLGIRRRLAPLLTNNRRKIELMNGLLCSLPGTPVIYYGDEIGMGDNIYLGDRDGVRTPMQWSADRNAGFSRANPQKLFLPAVIDFEYHYESLNVETQRNNPASLWWWMKRLIALRQRHPALSRGELEFLSPDNPKALAFVRTHPDETVLVVANLSRFTQYVELDMRRYAGMRPVELFGQTPFPFVGELPYLLTLGPFAFYWFVLSSPERKEPFDAAGPATIRVQEDWLEVFQGRPKTALEGALRSSLASRRWFGGKARDIQRVEVRDAVPLASGAASPQAALVLLHVDYFQGEPEHYLIPLGPVWQVAGQAWPEAPSDAFARVHVRQTGEEALLGDASGQPSVAAALLDAIARRRKFKGRLGEVQGTAFLDFRRVVDANGRPLAPSVLTGDQSNTSILYGDRFILKLFRRVDAGEDPELELGRFLTEEAGFSHNPPAVGAVEYRTGGEEPWTLAVLHRHVPNEGTAWRLAIDALGRYLELMLTRPLLPDAAARGVQTEATPAQSEPDGAAPAAASRLAPSLLDLAQHEPTNEAHETMGGFLQSAALLGRRTAEMHLALASRPDDARFAPEPFSLHYQRSLYQSLRKLTSQTLQLLRKSAAGLPDAAQADAQRVLAGERRILACFHRITARKISAVRIRCHGDYHLGQVLFTGKDFTIIDFEGEPTRTLSERRIKRSPIRDVAGMLRSFHYAASTSLFAYLDRLAVRAEEAALLRRGARLWHVWAGAEFLRAYLQNAGDAPFVPAAREELTVLLHVYLLEKAVYELAYELNNRPAWVEVPLAGIVELLDALHCE